MRSLRYALSSLVLAALLGLGGPASAQTVVDVRSTCDTAGIPGCQGLARSVFRVDDSGGIVATGDLGVGIIPASGAGLRMMWYPYKGAFRAGHADAAGQMDDANVGFYSWAGGAYNVAAGIYSFAMGNQNTVQSSAQCGMALGSGNVVYGSGGSIATCGIALGLNNDVHDHVGVAIGQNARSDGDVAVALGFRANAWGDYSVAIGYRASTGGRTGAFALSDASTTDSLVATANNQFSGRFAGGYRLFTNATRTTGVALNAGGSSWNVVSDRNAKEAFAPLDAEALLQRLARLPLSTWRYRDAGTDERHVGPMAQDWQALVDGPLGLNADDLTINQGDFDGVNLAGIVALEARTRALAEENAALRAEVEAMRADRAADAARVARLEATLARLVPADASAETMTASASGEARP